MVETKVLLKVDSRAAMMVVMKVDSRAEMMAVLKAGM
jgi:hypothetical protein